MFVNVVQVARICHEANRAYCRTIGDESQPFWDDAPEWQKTSAINGVKYHLNALEAGQEPLPSMSHENWLKEKVEQGWKYGPTKDPDKKEHPCCVPYDDLPVEQKLKDFIFAAIVKAFWTSGGNALASKAAG